TRSSIILQATHTLSKPALLCPRHGSPAADPTCSKIVLSGHRESPHSATSCGSPTAPSCPMSAA
ncbi:hypothetical protein B0H12DRAFT_1116497, partial [Mycena haematopus]